MKGQNTLSFTVTNGSEVRCAAQNTVTILIVPNSGLTWTTITVDWGDNSPLITLVPGQSLTLTHTFNYNTIMNTCTYNCFASSYNGVCFLVGIDAQYVGASPENSNKWLTFKRPPTATFTVTSPVCVNSPININPTFCPTNDVTSTFSWSFGNGITSTSANPGSITYSTAGTYTISLTHQNDCGTSSYSTTVVVQNPPIANALPSTANLCMGDTLQTNNTSQNATAYTWSVSPGINNVNWSFVQGTNVNSQQPNIKFLTAGNYQIVLTTAAPPCPIDKDTIHVQVDAPINMSLNPQADACQYLNNYNPSVNVNSNANADLSYFMLQSGNYVPVSFPLSLSASLQPYIVKIEATNNCGTISVEDTFFVKPQPQPIANATTITNICSGNSVSFSSAGSNNMLFNSYSWVISPGSNGVNWGYTAGSSSTSPNPVIMFYQAGNYNVILYGNNAPCPIAAATAITVNVIAAPTLILIAQPDTCIPFSYTPITTQGATISVTKAPNIPISSPYNNLQTGTYYINSSLSGTCGITTKLDTFVVSAPVPVSITNPSSSNFLICKGDVVNFQAQPNDGQGSWWLNGNIINASHTFNSGGVYIVKYMRGHGVCQTMDSVIVQVQAVTLTINNPTICVNQNTYQMTFSSSVSSGQSTWSSANCPTCINNNGLIQVGNANGNNFQVTLDYVSPDGCHVTQNAQVQFTNVKAHFSIPDSICIGNSVSVNTSTAIFDSVLWKVDGNILQPPFNMVAGNHIIKMYAFVGNCVDSMTQSIYVIPNPLPVFVNLVGTSGCSPLQIDIVPQGNPEIGVTYTWNFGRNNNDIFLGFIPPSPISYLNTGDSVASYQISLIVHSSCSSFIQTYPITVTPLPIADIGIDSTEKRCSPFHAILTNRSMGMPTTCIWDFGDGSPTLTTNDSVISHTFYAIGVPQQFIIRLIAINECAADTAYQSIWVYPPDIDAYFTLPSEEVCANSPITFLDASTPIAVSVLWNFGDGHTSTELNPTHTYTLEDTLVKVVLYASHHCGMDSMIHWLRILPSKKPQMAVPQMVCQGQLSMFENLTTESGINSYSWDFGDGTNGVTSFHAFHSYETAGDFIITLYLTSFPDACVSKSQANIHVILKPNAQVEVRSGCPPISKAIVLVNKSENATTYTWNYGDGTPNEEGESPSDGSFYTIIGNYWGALVAEKEGCKDTTRFYVPLDTCLFFIPNAFSPNGDGINDLFLVKGLNLDKIVEVSIFDRWGKRIYHIKDTKINNNEFFWDGKYQGQDVPEGVYSYSFSIIYKEKGEQHIEHKGSLTLFR
ncbi:MAG: PKD domain-containing protein [Bacteroidia bacterium]